MRPADAIKTCLAKSFAWKGRASRSEYWWFLPVGLALPAVCYGVLAYAAPDMLTATRLAVSALALAPLAAVTVRRLNDAGADGRDIEAPAGALVLVLVGLVVISKLAAWAGPVAETLDGPAVFGFAILIGVMLLVVVIPFVVIFLFGLMSGATLFGTMLLPSQPGSNKHGPNPNEVTQ